MSVNTLTLLDSTDIRIGDYVAEMHLHQPNSGICKNWSVQSGLPIPISEDTFDILVDNHALDERKLGNKSAHVIGVTSGADGFVTAVLVLYRYDAAPYLSMLWGR